MNKRVLLLAFLVFTLFSNYANNNLNQTYKKLPPCAAEAGVKKNICLNDSVLIGGSPTASGGNGGPYTYSWTPATGLNNPNIANPMASPATTTLYTVTISDGTCFSSDTVSVVVFQLPVVDAGPDMFFCYGQEMFIGGSPTGSGGSGSLSYEWSPSTFLNDSSLANPSAFPTTTITYTVEVTDQQNCKNSDSVVITVNPQIIAEAGLNSVSFCEGDSILLGGTPSGSGGSGSLSYSWVPSSGLDNDTIPNPMAAPVASGYYTLTVTDDSSCTAKDSIYINVNPKVVADAGLNYAVCSGNSVQIGGTPTVSGGTGTISINWSPSAGLSDPNIANPFASPANTTTYTLVLTDDSNCVATDSIKVLVNPTPIVDAGVSPTYVCSADSVLLGGSPTASGGTGSLTYNWSPASGLNNPNIANPKAFITANTSYILTVTDDSACVVNDTIDLILLNSPSGNAGAPSYNICLNDTVQLGSLSAGSNLIFSWSPATGLSNPNIPRPYAYPVVTTTYVLTVTDTSNGCVATDSTTVFVNPNPVADAGLPNISMCSLDSAQLGGSPTASGGTGPLSILWTPNVDLSSNTAPNPMAQPSSNTTYYLTVTDSLGCIGTDSINVTVNPSPTADAGAPAVNVCYGDSVRLGGNPSGSGGTGVVSYNWTPSTFLSNDTAANPTAYPTSNVTYYLTVTDDYSCTHTDSIVITVIPSPTADAGTDQGICYPDTVQIGGSPSGSGGTGSLTYSWTQGTTLSDSANANPNAFPSVTTNYILTVSDNNGCFDIDTIKIIVSNNLLANAGANDTLCSNDSLIIGGSPSASGGIAPYDYLWSPNYNIQNTTSANPNIWSKSDTTYYLTVTDSLGCTSIDSIFIKVNPAPVIDTNAMVVTDATCGLSNGSITGITVTSGTNPLLLTWTDASSNVVANMADLFNQPYGNYTLTVNDGAGCSAILNVLINQPPLPVIDTTNLSITNASCNLFNGSVAGLQINGGVNPLTVNWYLNGSSYSSLVNISNLDSGQYVLVVTDGIGCTDSLTVNVLRDTFVPVNAVNDFESTYENTPVSIPYTQNDNYASVSVSIYNTPDFGTIVSQNNSIINYQPNAGYFGYDTIQYSICDLTCSNICDSATILIFVEELKPVETPEGFSPNGDGFNDYFVIKNLEQYPENSIVIFNRWGDVVYKAEPYNNDWDGTTVTDAVKITGDKVTEGTYYYILKIKNASDTETINGFIELKR
ncbi:MAG: hypothetical protein Kow0079_01210 [Vicingaceae bacterium]